LAQRDGVELCDGLCHLTAGNKVTELRVIDLKDGSPLSCIDDGLVGRIFRTQSRYYCFAVKSLLGKDSKDSYKELKDFLLSLKRSGMRAYLHQNLGQQFFPLWSEAHRILAACENASTLVWVQVIYFSSVSILLSI
jgi:hypothetical protein